jgi:hypothetical protein
MANDQAWAIGAQIGSNWAAERRERKLALEDEQRRGKAADLHAEREGLRAQLAVKPNDEQLKAALLRNFQQHDQLYDPVHAPGALQKDWDFLKGLVMRRGRKQAAGGGLPAAMTAPIPGISTTPEQTIKLGDQTVPPLTPPAGAAPSPASATLVASTAPMAAPPAAGLSYAKPGSYVTKLPPDQETEFRKWVSDNKIPNETASGKADPTFTAGDQTYDMRGYWLAMKNGDSRAKRDGNTYHFPDIWKTPYHQSFSNESQYATTDAPRWDGNRLVDKSGKVVFEEGAPAEAGAPGGAVTLPGGEIKIPGTKLPTVTGPAAGRPQKATTYDRKLQAQQDRARQEMEDYIAAGPLTPAQEASQEVQKKLAGVEAVMKSLTSLPGLDMDEGDLADMKRQFLETALGIAGKEKYFSQLQTTVDPATGRIHVYRVPQKTGAAPEEIAFPEGQQFAGAAGKSASDGTKGSDFWKAVVAKYGPHPTAQQIEAERAHWQQLGAHGTTSYSTTDAAGNTVVRRVPVFTTPPSGAIIQQLGIPQEAGGDGSALTSYSSGGTPSGMSPLATAISGAEGFGGADTIPTRANNPGALELGDVGYGTLQAANGQKITVFGSVQDGWNALQKQIDEIYSGGSQHYSPDTTLEEFGQKYSGGDGNYGSRIASALGVDPSTTLGELQYSAASAGTGAAATGGVSLTPAVAAGAAGAAGTGAGTDFTEQSLQTTPATTAASPEQANAALAEADRLGIGGLVRGLASYKLNPAQVGGRGAQRSKLMDLVMKVNPAFDATKWQAVQAARTSFTAGKDADSLQALETAVNHLNTLTQAGSELGNTFNPTFNHLRNIGRMQAGSDLPGNFMSAGGAVADEVGRVFRNSGLTESEVQQWQGRLSPDMSPEQLQGAIQTITNLMAGRMAALANKYRNAFGNMRGFHLLDPAVAAILAGQPLKTEGAERILKINEEAGGPPALTKRTPHSGQAKGTVSMQDARRKYPGVSDDDLRKGIMQQGMVPVN